MVNKTPATVSRSAARPHGAEAGAAARRRRTRGRPKAANGDDVRQALLAAARDLFLRYGYRAVSSRQIAAAAGANVAMIRYYFGGKPGLYQEMVQGVLAPIRARLDAMIDRRETVDLGGLVSMITRAWAANPWIAGLVVREVLSPDGSLRTVFIRDIIGRIAPLVERMVQDEIDRGQLRPGLDPKLVVLSMVSLAAFPFLAFPVTSRIFGVSQDEEFLERLTRHSTQLLASGVALQPLETNK